MNNLPGLPNFGNRINESQSYVLTVENTTRAIPALAALLAFEDAHSEVVAEAERANAASVATSPQEQARRKYANPQEMAILQQNGLSPLDFEFTIRNLVRAQPIADRKKTPNQIGLDCNQNGGGGCTVQQVEFVYDHYAQLKALWERYDILQSISPGLSGSSSPPSSPEGSRSTHPSPGNPKGKSPCVPCITLS